MNMLVILISICGVLQCDPHLRAGGRVLPRAPGGVGGSCREAPLASSPSQPRPRQQGEVSGILEARAIAVTSVGRSSYPSQDFKDREHLEWMTLTPQTIMTANFTLLRHPKAFNMLQTTNLTFYISTARAASMSCWRTS